MGIRTYRCANSRASHGNCGCFGAVSPSRAARAFLRALVAVKLVQTGDEPLGTTNKAVRDSGTHGSWSMRCQQMREGLLRGGGPTNLRCQSYAGQPWQNTGGINGQPTYLSYPNHSNLKKRHNQLTQRDAERRQ